MPKDQEKHGSTRQRPVSCKFCRTRKLRCSRESPCSNCISRGLRCDLPKLSYTETASEPELLERLKRLEALLVNQKLDQRHVDEETLESGRPNFERSASTKPNVIVESTHSTQQLESLAHDVSWLENQYTIQGIQVCPLPCFRL
jgi:hypothetical protein